jgi:hypothetical protein
MSKCPRSSSYIGTLSVILAAALLSACGNDSTTATVNSSTSPGSLAVDPPLRIASLSASALAGELSSSASGAQLLQITGTPTCGVDFYYVKFWTTGGNKESTESSGALMVPTGGTGCSGARPIVLYAHGTNANQALNIANITDTTNTEGVLIAAMFAAQGYIVVAPNYAGYDISTLGYHPFLNAAQQSGEMMDILTAARTALPGTMSSATSDSGKLFITGYSEGGHVAMATERAMLAAGDTVTAAAPLSGPYALEAFGDAIFFGSVDIGSTEFAPLLVNSYQHAYGNVYSAPTDVFSATYAATAATQLPSTTPIDTLFEEGVLPELALFDSTAPVVDIAGEAALSYALNKALAVPTVDPANPQTEIFALGFGSPYLVTNDYRVAYAIDAATNPDGAVPTPAAGVPRAAAAPTQGLRLDLYTNDMRTGWAPTVPTLLCGGDADPTVFFSVNTETMEAYWSTQVGEGLVTVLDVGATPTGTTGFAPIQTAFLTSQAELLAYYQTAAGGGLSLAAATAAVVENYHTNVAPFCALAARSFFDTILGS